MAVPPPELDPQNLNAYLDILWKISTAIGGGAIAGILIIVGLRSGQKQHEEQLDEHEKRLRELEGRHNQAEVKMASLPTRDDLVAMQNQIQQQLRDSFNSITNLITRGHRGD